MFVWFLGINFLFHLVNVQCMNENALTTEIDGRQDEVDWPKNESKYFDEQDYLDYLKGLVRVKEVDSDYVKLRTMLKDISDIQNFLNEAEPHKSTASDTLNIVIQGILNEADLVKYQPTETVTVDDQSILNEVEINKNIPSEIVAKNIQRVNLDEIEYQPSETVPSDIQSILNELGFSKYQPTETVTMDIQSIFNAIKLNENTPTETVAKNIQKMNLYEMEFNKYHPEETVTIDIQSIFNEVVYNETEKDIPRMNLDEMEFNKYHPEETVTIDIQSIFRNDNEDPNVETITIIWQEDTPNHYSSYKRTAGMIGFIITLILAPFVIYQRCNAKKQLKLRVFVIKSKPEKEEPLIKV